MKVESSFWAGRPLQWHHSNKIRAFFFCLGMSPFTIRPLWKSLCIFHPSRSPTIIWSFQKFWILPRGRLPSATIPIQKVFFKDHLFLYKSNLIFPLRMFSSPWIMCFLALSFFLWACFWALTSKNFRRIDHFLIWRFHHISFLFILYKAYYLKSFTRLSIVNIVKRRVTIITHF